MKILKFMKAAIIPIIVAFIFVCLISYSVFYIGKDSYEMAINLLDLVTIKSEKYIEQITPVLKEKKLENYPAYGTKYATLKIETIGVDLPVYYGESYSVLKNGIGHDSQSYFPGEGGSIVYMGHNLKHF